MNRSLNHCSILVGTVTGSSAPYRRIVQFAQVEPLLRRRHQRSYCVCQRSSLDRAAHDSPAIAHAVVDHTRCRPTSSPSRSSANSLALPAVVAQVAMGRVRCAPGSFVESISRTVSKQLFIVASALGTACLGLRRGKPALRMRKPPVDYVANRHRFTCVY
jgi:hypothetical protein